MANLQQAGVLFLIARQGVKVTVSSHRHRPIGEDALQIIGQHMVILLPLFGNDLLRYSLKSEVSLLSLPDKCNLPNLHYSCTTI